MIARGQSLLKVSIFLNLVLLLTVAYQVHRSRKLPAGATISSDSTGIAQTLTTPAGHHGNADPLKTNGEKAAPAFGWSQLESQDYRLYIANLRSIGCPDQTICDIITADVNKLYAGREAALRPRRDQPFKYWETAEHNRISNVQLAEFEKKKTELETEKQSVLAQLLGDVCAYQLEPKDAELDLDRKLAFLTPAVQIKVRAILGKYPGLNDQIQGIVDQGPIPTPSPELGKVLAQYAQEKAELTQLLGPDNYEQYELATSWTAENVRRRLMGFNPTEDEFHAVFDIWRAQDESLATIYATGQPDPGTQQVNDAIKASLGDDRYAQYSKVWTSEDYHEVAQIAFDYQLPADTPAQIDSLRQSAQNQQEQLLADSTLTYEQRTAALQTLSEQTAKLVSRQLGPDAYQSYVQGNGNWIQNLAPPVPNLK